MKRLTQYSVALLLVFGLTVQAQVQQQKPAEEPIVNFRLPLTKASSAIYAIRYSTILDAKTANELADLMVAQANDTILNKPIRQKPGQK